MDPSTVPSTDLQAETAHTTHHLILDQISETIMGTQVTTIRTDRTLTETTETEVTNKIIGMNGEIITFTTGMTTIKIETGLIAEENQPNTSTTETS